MIISGKNGKDDFCVDKSKILNVSSERCHF